MESPGLTDLPVEVIHHISSYLSVQDVLSCSSTCHYLRAALNDNSVWRRYVPQDFPDLEIEEQVGQTFQMSESLTPLCEKRKQFARKNHLVNNWRAGNYVRYSNCSEYSFISGLVFNRPKGKGNLVYKDKYIFLSRLINDCESDGIEIWDISKTPVFHTFFKIDNVNYNAFHVVGSYLIITECLRVRVYHINLPDKDFPLLYSFLITGNNVTHEAIIYHTVHDFDCVSWNHAFVRNYLLSSKSERNRLHIWDIHNASKVGTFEPPEYAFFIILHSFVGSICMFKLIAQSYSSPNYLVTFNLDNNQFLDNRLSYDSEVHTIISYNSHVILIKRLLESNNSGLYDIICTLYDFNTSLEIRQRKFINAIKHYVSSSSSVVNGTFIITCHDSFHVINALTLETVNTLNHNNITSTNSYFNLYQNVIAVATNDKYRLELWDVSRNDMLLRDLNASYTSHLYFDSFFTKMVIIDSRTITVVHLW